MGLVDHAVSQERWARRRAARAALPEPFGYFLASLAPWDWFINPISFRDDWRNAHRGKDRPSTKSGPPCSDEGLAYVGEFLADIEAAAGNPVGWVIAEEFGALGGRWHCHGLICGVSHLRRDFWWADAFRRFGRTTIDPFDPAKAGAFYAAKYASKALGMIHFGGTLAGVELSRVVRCVWDRTTRRAWEDSLAESSEPVATHAVAALSANVERTLFRLGLRRWHR